VHWENEDYTAKLVDLPCIIESQKTLDRKQFYKIADISQVIIINYTLYIPCINDNNNIVDKHPIYKYIQVINLLLIFFCI